MPRHAAPSRPRRFKRRYIAATVIIPLLMGGAAYAYFEQDTATSHVNVAAVASFTILISPPTGGALSPGVGTEIVPFTVINQLNHPQTVNAETFAVTTDAAGGIYDTNTDTFVDSCLASWFDAEGGDGGVPLPDILQTGQMLANGAITVTMPANPTTDESACSGLSPQVSVTVS